jgi:hypothetical protein
MQPGHTTVLPPPTSAQRQPGGSDRNSTASKQLATGQPQTRTGSEQKQPNCFCSAALATARKTSSEGTAPHP